MTTVPHTPTLYPSFSIYEIIHERFPSGMTRDRAVASSSDVAVLASADMPGIECLRAVLSFVGCPFSLTE